VVMNSQILGFNVLSLGLFIHRHYFLRSSTHAFRSQPSRRAWEPVPTAPEN
jgi:hypothetical protein